MKIELLILLHDTTMIKKYKYIALSIVTVVLASCSSNEEPNANFSSDDYISFAEPTVNLDATLGDFANNPGTRAMSTNIDEFRVWAYCVPNNVKGDKNESVVGQEWDDKAIFFTSGADIFNGMKVISNSVKGYASYDQSNTEYSKDNFKQWHTNADARYTFIALYDPTKKGKYSMGSGSVTTEIDDQGKNKSYGPKLTFEIDQKSTTLIDDLIEYTDQPDALIAAKYDHRKSDGRVGLSFFHFMTGIRFRFNNYTSDKELVIKKVTFKGEFHKTATFDFTSDSPVMSVSGTYAGTFKLFEGSQSIPASGSEMMRNSSNEDPITLLLLPNPNGTTEEDGNFTLGSNKEIEIVYSFDGGKNRTFTYSNFTLSYLPQPNTLHTATFNFVGDEFIVMFQADDTKNWQNGSDNTVTIK